MGSSLSKCDYNVLNLMICTKIIIEKLVVFTRLHLANAQLSRRDFAVTKRWYCK